MLTRGLTLDPEYRMDTLDEAALWLQLVIRILDRAFPGGPTSVVGSQPIKATHDTKGIHVNTSGATGDFSPPWKATGKANRKDNSTVDFDLNFLWYMKSKPQQKSSQPSKLTGKVNRKISISGLWQKNDNAILPDDMSLNGWEFSSGIKFSNLGQLRAYINDQTQHAKQH